MFPTIKRWFLMACTAVALTVSALLASALPAHAADPAAARIEAFYAVLLETMKDAKTLGINGRYDKLAPAITATFDLPTMTRLAVGPSWAKISAEEQASLIEHFTRMTIATYASRFDGYSGEKFVVDPEVKARSANRIVQTKLILVNEDPVALNYLMRGADDDWKIVDIYVNGAISELAMRRSEFANSLRTGGAAALIVNLQKLSDKLMTTTH